MIIYMNSTLALINAMDPTAVPALINRGTPVEMKDGSFYLKIVDDAKNS